MTMIDPVTNWFEIGRVFTPSAAECQRVFDSLWLARYPRPREIGFDNGNEFQSCISRINRKYGFKTQTNDRLQSTREFNY